MEVKSFNFNIKEAMIYQAVKWEKHPVFRLAKPFKKIFLILFLLFFLIFIYGFLTKDLTFKTQKIFLSFSIIFLTLAIFSWYKIFFLKIL